MFRRLIYFTILIIYVARTHGKYRYDYLFNRDVGGWVKLHRIPANFRDAFLRCNLEGAMLASPLDDHYRKVMIMMLKASNVECAVFTGIHATISKGDFETIDGIPLLDIPVTWAPEEPNNLDNEEDCIIMLANGTLADVRCNETYPYICYKKKSTTPVITGCGTMDTEYTLELRTGSCYKFHRIAKTWRQAEMTCRADGGHLVIVNSDVESAIVKEMFAKAPRDQIRLAESIDIASAGFLSWGNSSSTITDWYTVHGKRVEAAGFGIWEWSSGYPTRCSTCRCGGLLRSSGKLVNVNCDSAYSFICEKAPASLIRDDEE